MYIYLIVNHIAGKYYVGQHKGDNLKQYLQKKFYEANRRLGGQSRLYASIRKHGREAFTIHSLLTDVQTRSELDAYERDFIAFLKSQNPEYGYNICRGGEGRTGPHTEASRKKLSDSAKRVGCLIPHRDRVRGGRIGGSVRSEAQTQHCKAVARLGGLVGGLATGAMKSMAARAGGLAQPLEAKVNGGLKGGRATANKVGFLVEIGRIARCKHWQIDRGKPCICEGHISH